MMINWKEKSRRGDATKYGHKIVIHGFSETYQSVI